MSVGAIVPKIGSITYHNKFKRNVKNLFTNYQSTNISLYANCTKKNLIQNKTISHSSGVLTNTTEGKYKFRCIQLAFHIEFSNYVQILLISKSVT